MKDTSTSHQLARVFSLLFHPALMPTLGFMLVLQPETYLRFTIPEQARLAVFGWVFLTTFIIPVILVLFLEHKGLISSLSMPHLEERRAPYFMVGSIYFFTYYLLKELPFPQPLTSMMFGAAISLVVALLASYRWKISLHMIGIGGVVGAIYGISVQLNIAAGQYLILPILVAGLVGFSRLRLKAHNQAEVYAGMMVGVLCEYLAVINRWG